MPQKNRYKSWEKEGEIVKTYRISIILTAMTIILSILSIFIGVIDVTGILNGNYQELELIFISRLPRLLAILCTGVGMSIAGLIMQQLCMNKFVSPTTGATISSAQFGVLLSLIWFNGATLIQKSMIAFATSIIGTWLYVYFIQKIKFKDIIMVPLIGIMFGNIINGVTSYFSYKYDMIQSLSTTLVGDFSLVIKGRYEIVFLVLPLVIISYIYANHFNIVGMGENFAKNLGVNYSLVLFMGLSISALITASIVVTVGTISYVGLIIPNMISIFKGDKMKGNIIEVGLLGGLFVLICDILGRIIIFPYELPIDLIVGVVGSLMFIGLMFEKLSPRIKKRRVGAA